MSLSATVTSTTAASVTGPSSTAVTSASATATPSSSSAELPASSFLHSAAELTPAAASSSGSAPAPPPLLDEPVRIWVGNIQPHVAEHQLLRLARPAGTITRFDFLLHGAGPQAGRPRGYAFVSYSTHREADMGRRRLDGAFLAGARLVCRWAHEQVLPGDVPLRREEPPAATAPTAVPAPTAVRAQPSAEAQIRAIEEKLQHMAEQRFAVTAASEVTDVRRLPRVRGPLSWVNRPDRQTAGQQQTKPYSRRRW